MIKDLRELLVSIGAYRRDPELIVDLQETLSYLHVPDSEIDYILENATNQTLVKIVAHALTLKTLDS